MRLHSKQSSFILIFSYDPIIICLSSTGEYALQILARIYICKYHNPNNQQKRNRKDEEIGEIMEPKESCCYNESTQREQLIEDNDLVYSIFRFKRHFHTAEVELEWYGS